METKSYILTALTLTGLVVCQFSLAANAAEPGNARFMFAPNYFRHEEAAVKLPTGLNKGAGHNGSVPTSGASALGISPKLFEAPKAPPVIQTRVAAVPRFAAPTPNVPPTPAPASVAATPPAAEFGKPGVLKVPQVSKAAGAKHGSPATSVNTGVHGKLLHHPMRYSVPAGQLAQAKSIDSYGKGFGYAPGPLVQAKSSSDGVDATKDVFGKLIK